MNGSNKPDDNYWFPFEPAVWLRDTSILSPAARGVWMHLICYAYTSPERGVVLMQNGMRPDAEAMRRLCACDAATLQSALSELEATGVASKRADGAIYCRRMVREEADRKRKSAAGKRAARMRWGCESMGNHSQSQSNSHKEPLDADASGGGSDEPPKQKRTRKIDASTWERYLKVVRWFGKAYQRGTGNPQPGHDPASNIIHPRLQKACAWFCKEVDSGRTSFDKMDRLLVAAFAGEFYIGTPPADLAEFRKLYPRLLAAKRKDKRVNETPGAERGDGTRGRGNKLEPRFTSVADALKGGA